MTAPYRDYSREDEEDHNSCVCAKDPCPHLHPAVPQVLADLGKYL